MEEKKQKASTAAKSRYNDKMYSKIAVRVPKDLAAAFKVKCETTGISQAQIFKNAIEDFLRED